MSAKRKFFKFSLWVFIILTFLFILVLFGSSFFADRIGNAVISELNKSVKHEIKVDNYDLTLVRHFPNAAVTLHNVTIPDKNNEAALLEAKELAFRFKLFSLFGSKIKISSVVIDDGAIFLKRDNKGYFNYDIFKENNSTSEEEENELSLKLEEARLNEMELIYMDEKEKSDLKVNIGYANMAGEFSGNRFILKSDAELITEFYETIEGKYFANKNIQYNADVDVDLKNENYDIKDFILTIEDNKFQIKGDVKKDINAFDYDLTFDGKDCTMQSLIGLLPEGYMENLIGLKSKGDFTFQGTIKGKSDNKQPAININLGLEDGSISGPQLASPFRDLTFNAEYTNGKDRTNQSTLLEIKDFKGYLQRELIELKLKVANLDDPFVDLSFNGAIPLDAVYKSFGSNIITAGGGDIEIQNLELKGHYDEMINPNLIYRVKSNGLIEFDDAMLKINGEKIIVDRGAFQLSDNDLDVREMIIEGAGSEFEINGSFKNLIPVLLSDSLNSKDAKLIFNAKLDAEELDLQRILNMSSVPDEESVAEEVYDSLKTEQYENREKFTNYLDGTIESSIEEFSYGKIKGKDFKGKLTIRNNEFIVDGGLFAMDGSFDLDGIIFMEKAPILRAKLVCQDIDGTEFFKQTDNFGQDYLTHKNLKGKINSNIAINAFWSTEGDFLSDKLHVLADTHIKDGELINFEMLESFSKFVKLKDLRHIRFTDTRNWMEIKEETFYLPVMLIQSNALNLTLSGEHSFDQKIDYNVKVNAGQVMMKKLFKKAGSKPIKAKNGWFNLHYKIKGTTEDYTMENSKRRVKEEFEKSERKKLRLKRALEQQFGNIKNFTTIKELEDEG